MEKLSCERYIELFKGKGYELLSMPSNTKEKVECCDKDGYKYLTSYDGLRDSRTKELAKFKKNNPFKVCNMRLYISLCEPNSEILMSDTELIDTKGKPIVFKCPKCTKPFEKRWEHYTIQREKVCPECNHAKRAEKQKVPFEQIVSLFQDAGLVLLAKEEDYKNRESRLACKDKDGFKFIVKSDSIKLKVFNCIERYAMNNPFALENLNHYIRLNNLRCKAIKRIDGRTWEFMCDCGKSFTIYLTNFLKGGVRCPDCVKQDSKYSLKVKEWLEDNNILFTKEHRFDDCRNIKPLPFDFAIKQNGKWVLIEVDGQQHFYTTPWTNEEDLHNQKIRDRIKDDYCKKNGHTLVRIPYWKVESGSYIKLLTQTLLV